MSTARTPGRLDLPETLQDQLHAFRRRVWTIKVAEALLAASFGVVVASLLMFGLDRLGETPGWARATLFGAAALGIASIPVALRRWVWGNRKLEQLARLLTRKHPGVGDQLLGVIELSRSGDEQGRSRALCEAAIAQVADDASRRDFRDAVPNPRHRTWAWLVAVPSAAAALLFAVCPDAASNAWARLLAPWGSTPRYTFADLEPLPAKVVVAHGEPFALTAKLAARTAWTPKAATATLGHQQPVAADVRDGAYHFDLPAQIDAGRLDVRVGDADRSVAVEPMLRPELNAVVADVTLPGYLGRPGVVRKDVKGGAIALVRGSRARFTATAGRDLASAEVDGATRTPVGASVTSPEALVEGERKVEFRWKDTFGLAGKEPFSLAVKGRADEAPTLMVEGLPRLKVVLDSEQLRFKVAARDDFGVRRVGIEWRGADDDPTDTEPTRGERLLGAGGNDKELLELAGTFEAKALGIKPQPIAVRVFAEDYLPGRGRAYSATSILYVLSPEQHAIWVTEQLSKWHRQALEVRDKEMQLFEANKELRSLSAADLDRPENRKKVEAQSAAERANGRRLTNLANAGDDLVRQAMRNPEFGVGHLEKWAAMLQVLKDIAGNRMPNVADLLKEGAQAPKAGQLAKTPPKPAGPTAGQNLNKPGTGRPREERPGVPKLPVPTVGDGESTQLTAKEPPKDLPPDGPKNPSGASLRLPTTTLNGAKPPEKASPAAPLVEEAVSKQQDLLAEFEKVSEELNKILANLEGSTLVKRLKAASRSQTKIAGRVVDQVGETFGAGTPAPLPGRPAQAQGMPQFGRVVVPTPAAAPAPTGPVNKVFAEMAEQEAKGSRDVSMIMDDMQAYFERRRFQQFKGVLDEMRKVDVIGSLRNLGDDIKREPGISVAQAEFWSDTLDRWAEDLVDPANSGSCPGGKTPASLPPSVVLEVMQILEGEINLREETRVAEQARPALAAIDHSAAANKLSATQKALRVRTEKVTQRIIELPDSEREFPKEIALLGEVSDVMDEAQTILAKPETGGPAMAAETEVIELLLKSKRINPGGGGGGGSSPGGGGKGTTNDSALALVGGGVNQKEVREDRGISQATGESGPSLPEEFRSGLDEYFNRIDRGPAGR